MKALVLFALGLIFSSQTSAATVTYGCSIDKGDACFGSGTNTACYQDLSITFNKSKDATLSYRLQPIFQEIKALPDVVVGTNNVTEGVRPDGTEIIDIEWDHREHGALLEVHHPKSGGNLYQAVLKGEMVIDQDYLFEVSCRYTAPDTLIEEES